MSRTPEQFKKELREAWHKGAEPKSAKEQAELLGSAWLDFTNSVRRALGLKPRRSSDG
jgi:hypothetical protein